MRKLIFKKIINPEQRKRYIAVEEINKCSKLKSTVKKSSFMYVKSIHSVTDKEDIKKAIDKSVKKDVRILRKIDVLGDVLKMKMKGSFSVIAHGKIFNILFVHSIILIAQKKEY